MNMKDCTKNTWGNPEGRIEMKLYKYAYDEKAKKLDIVEFEGRHEFDYSNDPGTNFYESIHSYTAIFENAKRFVDEYNALVAEGKSRIIKCKECGIFVLQSEGEMKWFKDRGLTPPKRCPDCIDRRKRGYRRIDRV